MKTILVLLALACLLPPSSAGQEPSTWSPSPPPPPPSPKRPHILLVLADDYGWSNIGYHRADSLRGQDPVDLQAAAEVHTPTLDKLAAEGIKLERHYAYKICSPSRSSLQSGRLAIHVNTENTSPLVWNPSDPVSGYAGIPRNMTAIGTKMQQAGYRTAMVGKWDAGMATPEQTPQGRGYEQWYGYFQHSNHYWTKKTSLQSTGEVDLCLNHFHDLFEQNATYCGGVTDPTALSSSCADSTSPDPACYEEKIFKDKAVRMISEHPTSEGSPPLFMFYAFHLLHTPLQVPAATLAELDALVLASGGEPIEDKNRRLYAAMTLYMDQTVSALVEAAKANGDMWENTLLIFLSDNGGPLYEPGAANNHPHRGGKYSDFEGGVRTTAFVSGGFVPAGLRGSSFDGVISIADWYSTLCGLAGIDPADHAAEAANIWLEQHHLPTLPPIDSIDQWHSILANQNARTAPLELSANAILEWPYKLVTGPQPYSMYAGPLFPNCSTVSSLVEDGPVFTDLKIFNRKILYSSNDSVNDRVTFTHDCGHGCLFDVQHDPSELHDLAGDPEHATRLQKMKLHLSQVSLFSPDRGNMTSLACQSGVHNGGYYGPFVHADNFYTNVAPPSIAQRIKDRAYMELVKKFNSTEAQAQVVEKFERTYQTNFGHNLYFKGLDSCKQESVAGLHDFEELIPL